MTDIRYASPSQAFRYAQFGHYQDTYSTNDSEQPLFTFVSGLYLTRQELSDTLKRLLPSVSEDSLSSQSFRIRAATPAAAAGVPDWFIKVLGRWSSDCYERHINTPSAIFDRMPSMLCSLERPNYERCQTVDKSLGSDP